MPAKAKVKSFNGTDWREVALRLLVAAAIAVVIVLLAVPQIFQYCGIPFMQIAVPPLRALGISLSFPRVDPAWGWLSGPWEALASEAYGNLIMRIYLVSLVSILAIEVASVVLNYMRLNDGTWLGPKRVQGDPGGSAHLISAHGSLRRILKPWDGKSAPKRSGLPVAYFSGKFWLLDYINLLVYGAPGCGKTRRVLIPAICGHIAAGDSVLCLDPKGELGDYTEGFAKGNGYKVVRVMVDNPLHSPDTINPLDAAITFAKTGRMDDAVAEVSGIAKVICPTKSKGNPHFDDSARSLCEGLLLAVIADPDIPEECKNLATVNAVASFAAADGSTGLDRIRKIARELPNGHPAKSKLSQVANTGDEEASSIISTFTNKLNDYVDARVSKMLWKSTFHVEDMAKEKTIIYLSFTSANGNYGKLVTTLVTNAISALRREAARQGGRLRRECYLLLEEMAQMERIDTIYSDAGIMRGEGIHLLLVLQEKSQLLTKYTREEAASLTGCCDDTLVLSVNELEVAKELSGKIGTYSALMRTSNESRSSNAGTLYGSASNGATTTSLKRDVIAPDEMLRWGPDIGNLLIGHGGVYALPSPELSKTFINGMLGLGDREFNDKLRVEKKAARIERNSKSAPIWLPDDAEKSAEEAVGELITSEQKRQSYNPLRF